VKGPGKMLPRIIGFILHKPVTVLYPKEKLTPPESFRGKIKFDASKCIGCGLCARDCPSRACQMTEVGGKKQPCFDLDYCTFCGQCAESCPKKAIEMGKEFELAHYKKGEVVVK
jgi:formate hydrogenlyase subunit 6/NADH:ubiquinone oxidoreductase subunit I